MRRSGMKNEHAGMHAISKGHLCNKVTHFCEKSLSENLYAIFPRSATIDTRALTSRNQLSVSRFHDARIFDFRPPCCFYATLITWSPIWHEDPSSLPDGLTHANSKTFSQVCHRATATPEHSNTSKAKTKQKAETHLTGHRILVHTFDCKELF